MIGNAPNNVRDFTGAALGFFSSCFGSALEKLHGFPVRDLRPQTTVRIPGFNTGFKPEAGRAGQLDDLL